MIKTILDVTSSSVTVLDANDNVCTVSIELTPKRRYITQASKRAILATGFLARYGEDVATDKGIIDSVIASIRSEILASIAEILDDQ